MTTFSGAGLYQVKNESFYDIYVHGNILTYTSSSNDIEIISLPELKRIGVLKGHTDATKSIKFSEDGKSLLSCSNDGTVRLWDLQSMKQISSIKVSNEELFSLDSHNNYFAVSSESEIILGEIGKQLKIKKKLAEYHTDYICQVKFYGKFLLSGSDDGCVNMFDLTIDNDDDILIEVLNTEDGILKFGFLKNKYLYVLTHTHTLTIYDWQNNKKLLSVDRTAFKADYFVDVNFSGNNALLFTGTFDGNVCAYKLDDKLQGECIAVLKGHEGHVKCAWTNGKCIITGGDEGKLILWMPKQ
jgi:WD40 repeat protein